MSCSPRASLGAALLAKSVLVGGAALASPSILSLVAPPAAAATSGSPVVITPGATTDLTEDFESYGPPVNGFDDYPGGQPLGSTWTVTGDSVDIVSAHYYGGANPSTVLDASGEVPGGITTTTFRATPGTS